MRNQKKIIGKNILDDKNKTYDTGSPYRIFNTDSSDIISCGIVHSDIRVAILSEIEVVRHEIMYLLSNVKYSDFRAIINMMISANFFVLDGGLSFIHPRSNGSNIMNGVNIFTSTTYRDFVSGVIENSSVGIISFLRGFSKDGLIGEDDIPSISNSDTIYQLEASLKKVAHMCAMNDVNMYGRSISKKIRSVMLNRCNIAIRCAIDSMIISGRVMDAIKIVEGDLPLKIALEFISRNNKCSWSVGPLDNDNHTVYGNEFPETVISPYAKFPNYRPYQDVKVKESFEFIRSQGFNIGDNSIMFDLGFSKGRIERSSTIILDSYYVSTPIWVAYIYTIESFMASHAVNSKKMKSADHASSRISGELLEKHFNELIEGIGGIKSFSATYKIGKSIYDIDCLIVDGDEILGAYQLKLAMTGDDYLVGRSSSGHSYISSGTAIKQYDRMVDYIIKNGGITHDGNKYRATVDTDFGILYHGIPTIFDENEMLRHGIKLMTTNDIVYSIAVRYGMTDDDIIDLCSSKIDDENIRMIFNKMLEYDF